MWLVRDFLPVKNFSTWEGVISYPGSHRRFLAGAGRELLSSSCAAALLAGTSASALSQDAAPQWGAWGELGAQAGSESSAFLEGFMPIAQDGAGLIFLDMRLDYGENAKGSSSFGLGLRKVVGSDLILGANAFVDVVRTDNRKVLLGSTLGLEAFTSNFDLRINAHVPLSGSAGAGSSINSTGVTVANNQLVETRSRTVDRTALLYGLTGEIGALFDSPFGENQRLRAYAGGYLYDRENFSTQAGARLGLEYRIDDVLSLAGSRFTLGAELVYDKDDKFDAVASARLRIPLFGGSEPPPARAGRGEDRLLARMDEGVRRDKGIRAGKQQSTTAAASIPVTNPTTGRAYGGVYYVDQTGTGTGSYSDPTNLATAIANAGTDGVIVVIGDNGTVSTAGATLRNGQYLVGGGSTVGVRLASGATTSFLVSGTAGTIDGDPGVTTVTLADGVWVNNLTLRGGGTVLGGTNVTGARLTNLAISDATDGVRITGAVNTTLSNLTFSNITGTSVFLNNQGALLSGITIDGGTNGIVIANNTGTSTLSSISMSNVSGDALSFTNNTGSLNVNGFTATNTGDDAVAITGGGTFAFSGTTRIDGLGAGATSDGIDLSSTSGASLTFGDVDITGLGGGTGLNMAGADASLTMQSLDITGTGVTTSRGVDISGTQNGRLVNIVTGGNISNVGTGIVLGANGGSLAAPDAAFTWGGGDIGGLLYALDGVGVNAANGSYSFGATSFSAPFNFTQAGTPNYFVAAHATGTGDGSSTANAASIGTAVAAAGTLGTVNFILINDGSAIDTAGLTFQLADDQTVDTFGDGRTFTSSGYVIAANITGSNLPSGSITITDPTGLGAATITSSSGGVGTIGLANGNAIRNITVGSSAGTAISGSGITGLVIEGVTVGSGGTTAQNGIDLANTSGSVVLTNVAIDAVGSGLVLAGASGTVTGNNVDISGKDTLSVTGGDAAVSFNASSSVDATSGTAVTITGRIGGSFSHFGTVSANGTGTTGIAVSGALGRSDVTFSGAVSLGQTTALGGGAGVSIDNNGTSSTVAFDGGLAVTTSGRTGLTGQGGGTVRIANAGTETITTTGAMALSLTGLTSQVSFDTISATNMAMTSVSLTNLDGSFTVNGGSLTTGVATAGFASFDVLQDDAGATRALQLLLDGITIRHDATTTTGGIETGLRVRSAGDDTVALAVRNATFETEDLAAQISGSNGGTTVTGFANTTLLGSATAFDPTRFNNGVQFSGVTFDADLATAGLQAVSGGTFTAGTSGTATAAGLSLVTSSGANSGRLDFTSFTATTSGTALEITGDQPAMTLGIAAGAITGGAVLLDAAAGLVNGDITLASLALSSGLVANGFAGSFTVTGATTITAPETFTDLGGGSYQRETTTAVSVVNSSGNFSFGDLTVASAPGANTMTGGATVGINLAGNGGTFTVAGTTTISDTVEDAIRIADTSGAISFNRVTISNPHATRAVAGTFASGGTPEAHSAGVDISGKISGAISFADLDIALNSASSTGIELTGATLTATVTANDFDLTGNGSANTIAVDLRGVAGGGAVRLGDPAAAGNSSSIAGVDTGVWVDGTSNAAFTFGDGEDAADQASTIQANTAINAAAAPTSGTYDFRDVAFASDPGLGFGTGRIYFVDADGAGGGGDGSGRDASNPMTITDAEAVAAAGDVIVLINNGAVINVSGTNGNDTLNLLDQVQLLGFGDGTGGSRSVTVSLTVPPTILLSASGVTIDDPTGTGGAATLITSAGNNVVTLGSTGNRISGLILDGNGTAARGINDSGGAANTTIERSIIRNFTSYGVEITPSTGTSIDRVTFSGNAGDILLNAANSTLRNITATGATGTSITLTDATGSTVIENVTISGAANGLAFNNAAGTVNAGNVAISGANTLSIVGGDAAFTFDAASSINATSGTAVTISARSGGSFTHKGTVSANGTGTFGLRSVGATGAHTVSFTGTFDIDTVSALAGTAVFINNAGQAASFLFADLDIATDGDVGLTVQNGGTLGIATGTITVRNSGGINLSGIGLDTGTGVNLTSFTNTNASTTALSLDGVTGGTFTVSGTTTASGTTGSAVSLTSVSSAVSFGALTLTPASGDGLLLDGNPGALTTGDITIDMGAGSGRAIRASGTNGNVAFGNVDVTNLGAGTGLDLSGGTFDGQVTFASLDITGNGTTGSRGIDLTGYDNSKDVVTANSGSIHNVETGIDLTSANIADGVRFQYGDGSGTNPGTESKIDTTGFAVVTTGMAATGEFDLEDVDFGSVLATTNTSNLQGVSYYVVGSTGATGAGAGTFFNPGTIAGAEASGASAIILVDNNADTVRTLIDAVAQDDGTLGLADGQVLVTLVRGETVDLAALGAASGGAPASLKLTGINTGSTVTTSLPSIDTVRPILTSSSSSSTVSLAGSATVQNVSVRNTGTGDGIAASYSANATARIRSTDATVTGNNAYAFNLTSSSGTSSLEFSDITTAGGVFILGIGGTLSTTATGTNTIGVGGAGTGLYLDRATVGAAGFAIDSLTTSGNVGHGVAISNVGGTGAVTLGSVTVDGAQADGISIINVTAAVNLGTDTAGTGLRIGATTAVGNNGISIVNGSGAIAIGNGTATSVIAAGLATTSADGISITNSDAAITATNLDINRTGSGNGGHGIYLIDNNAAGSFTLAGTNTIDNTGQHGVSIVNATASLSGLTLGGSATGAANDISGNGIDILSSSADAHTVTLSDITMGGAAGDAGDVAGTGINIAKSVSGGALTVNLAGTNVIRSTGQAFVARDTAAPTAANSVLLSISGTTFESAAAGQPTVAITGKNLSATSNSIQVRGFANNAVTGNGSAGGIRFEKVDFDGDGSDTAVAGGTLNVGQGTSTRVAGDGLAFIDTSGEAGFTTLNIFNDGGTGLLVDTKTNGLATDFTLTGGGSGTVNTTSGTALFLDPLTMNLTFDTVTSTGGTYGVFIDAGDAGGGAGANALTIGTLNTTGASGAGLRITNSTGTFNFGATTINTTATTGQGVDIDVTNGGTLNVNFTGNLDIDTGAGTGLDAQSSGGSTVTMQTAAAATTAINTTTGRLINAENLLAGAGGVTFDTLAASGTVAGHAVSLDLDAGAFSGGALSVAGTTGGHGVLLGGTAGSISFDSATIANVANTFYGVSSAHAGTVTFTTVGISGSQNGLYTTGNGAVSVNGGTVNVAGGRGVWIDGGGGAISIAADITKSGAGEAVYVASRTGSTATFSGDITFTGGGATGINVESNSGGTVSFSGLSTLATGANTAVRLLNNTGATVNFTGGLDIDTTSGTGFSATGGGTVSVSGGARTINTATGQGVVMNTIAVGAGGIFFDAVEASGTTAGNFVDLQTVSGGSFRVASTNAFGVTGTGIRVNSSSADFIFNSIVLGRIDTPGPMTYGLDLDGNSGSFTTTASNIIDYAQTAGIRIANSADTFSADFQAQIEVRNRTTASYIGGGDGLQLNNNGNATVSFAGFVFSDWERGDLSGAGGQGIVADDGGQLTIQAGSVTTNNNMGADTAAIDIRNTAGYDITLDWVFLDNDNTNETGGGFFLLDNPGASLTVRDIGRNIEASDAAAVHANNSGTLSLGTVTRGNITADGRAVLDVVNTTLNIRAINIRSSSSTGNGLRLQDVAGSVSTSGTLTLESAAGDGALISSSAATLQFGTTTITNAGADGLDISGSGATFGATTISNPGARGIVIGTTSGVTFGNVDITGLANNTTGVDLRNASGAVTFNTLDISSAALTTGTRGIDLRGATNASNMVITASSTINNLAIGVDLSGANITGTFQYGDGEGTTNTNSLISNTTTAIEIASLTANGTYNFEDVAFTGSGTANLAGSGGGGTVYWVAATATGTGDGSSAANAGTIVNAAAATADYIVLLDNAGSGGQDTINLGGTALVIDANQTLLSFRVQDVFTFGGGGAPANVLLTGISGALTITNPNAGSGAPLLVSGNGTDSTIRVSNGSVIDGIEASTNRTADATGTYFDDAVISAIDLNGSFTVRNSRLLVSSSRTTSGVGIIHNTGFSGTTVAQVSNNDITHFGLSGIDATTSGTGRIDLTATNNTISGSGAVSSGVTLSVYPNPVTICANISGNTISASGGASNGITLDSGVSGATLQLAGYGGANNDQTAITSFLTGQNTISGANTPINYFVETGATITNAAACTLP